MGLQTQVAGLIEEANGLESWLEEKTNKQGIKHRLSKILATNSGGEIQGSFGNTIRLVIFDECKVWSGTKCGGFGAIERETRRVPSLSNAANLRK